MLYCDKYRYWEIELFMSGHEVVSHGFSCSTESQDGNIGPKICPQQILQCLVSNTPQHLNIVDVINLQSLTYMVAHDHSYLSGLMPSGAWPLGEQQACCSEGRLRVGEPARGTAGLHRATKSNA